MKNETKNEAEKPALQQGAVSSRFSITINDDDGKVSLEIIDHLTKRQVEISADELMEVKEKEFSISKMCGLIVKVLKPKFREIATR
ncbi:MAG: hypothetical protein AABZ32_00445 [Bacteroidota bacterium]